MLSISVHLARHAYPLLHLHLHLQPYTPKTPSSKFTSEESEHTLRLPHILQQPQRPLHRAQIRPMRRDAQEPVLSRMHMVLVVGAQLSDQVLDREAVARVVQCEIDVLQEEGASDGAADAV